MIGRFLFAALCLLSAGCTIPLFEHPLQSPATATVPTGLFGVYKQVGGPKNVAHHVHLGPCSLRSFVHANIESGLFSETVTAFERND